MTRIERDAAAPLWLATVRARGPALVSLVLLGCASSPAGLDLSDDAVDRATPDESDEVVDAGSPSRGPIQKPLDAAVDMRGRMVDAARAVRPDAGTQQEGGGSDAGDSERSDALDGGPSMVSAPLGPTLGQVDGAVARPSALCDLPAVQVGVIGDSYLALNGEVVRGLELNASAAGALAPDEHYVDFSQSGASLAYPPSIGTQFAQLTAATRPSGGVKLVIMDGGGNDVLVYNQSCLDERTATADCRFVVDQGLRALKRLFAEMRSAGVEHVVYFWYPDLTGGGLGGSRPWVINRYAAPLFEQACTNSADVTCHFVETAPLFAGHPEYISPLDRVHPTIAGSRAIADAIWKVMTDNCLAST